MTTTADNRIDEFISRVKNHGAIADFCFVPAFPPNKTPNPVKKYTVAVENLGMSEKVVFVGDRSDYYLNGRLYEIKLRLRVYAPSHTSGSALLRACALLADALEAEDSERFILSTSFSGIGFDTASRTEYRDVIAVLGMLLSEEADT